MLKKRPYQDKAVKAVLDAYDAGNKKVGIVMSVGSGKTITFCRIIDQLIKRTGKKALILAHREELLVQAQKDLSMVNPTLTSTIEQGSNKANMRAKVVIASVPTLGRSGNKRIEKFNPDDFCIIVTDEMHHFTNSTYTNIFRHFHTLKNVDDNNRLLLLGVTATGFRSDDQKLEDIINDIVFEYDMITAIKQGYLSPLRAFTVRTNVDITGVKKSGDDFNIKELGETINNDERNKIVLETFKNYCKDEQTMIFCVNVDHAETLTKIFKNEGISAECVTGGTPREERKQIVKDFKDNKINVLLNVGVFTEGTNIPNIKNIIMARPTRSLGLYIQIIGRSTRLSPGKKHAVIYDIVDNAGAQGIQTMSSVLGIGGGLDFCGKDLLEIKDFVDKLKNLSPNVDWTKVDVNNPESEIKNLDLIAGLKVPSELSPFTTFSWAKLYKGQYRLNLGSDKGLAYKMVLRQNAVGKFEVYVSTYKKIEQKTSWMKINSGLTLTDAINVADQKVLKQFKDKLPLIERSAYWRKQEPTEKQLKILNKFKVSEKVIEQLDKGMASTLMDKLFSEKPKKERKLTKKQQNYLKWKGKWGGK